ncbi:MULTISPECIES: hypothetical protein [Asticcacaulis]|jgi:hypothetical protein|uniref:hypothetical protein n=1 Tax=Asticcacaulis TaxID=76890 RepID=UPI001AE8822E|nr:MULTISPECIES: hypothetical protein [Asticcacaulis]MBP2160557.1 hypothetical protein [Asticcacaulis solisilvae]MDR6801602.1 hypothetical protein [Asticcacaulis sp. BE141]
MKHIIIVSALALFAAGGAYAAAPETVKDAVKSCCEAMEKCCCCDKDKAADKKDGHEGHAGHN